MGLITKISPQHLPNADIQKRGRELSQNRQYSSPSLQPFTASDRVQFAYVYSILKINTKVGPVTFRYLNPSFGSGPRYPDGSNCITKSVHQRDCLVLCEFLCVVNITGHAAVLLQWALRGFALDGSRQDTNRNVPCTMWMHGPSAFSALHICSAYLQPGNSRSIIAVRTQLWMYPSVCAVVQMQMYHWETGWSSYIPLFKNLTYKIYFVSVIPTDSDLLAEEL